MIYAQYRFGRELLESMPPELRRSVGRFRQLYDMGLHGPELLDFTAQGQKFLLQSGDVFFDRVCRAVRMDRSEGAMAYLYGLIAYYAINSVASPYINRAAGALGITPGRVRTEFDRYLLERDGHSPAYRYDRSRHIHLTPGECDTVSMFYPGVSGTTVEKSVKKMARVIGAPVLPAGSRRDMVVKLMELQRLGDSVIATRPERRLKSANEDLARLYELARQHYSSLLEQVQTRLRKKVPFGPDFSLPLG